MGLPKVSVVMNCYNAQKYLREAIDSVYAQTYSDWEIVFLDDASTDASSAIAKSCDSRLRYFCSERRVPLGAARNLALEQCRGELIAFLDCDDLWLPTKLEKQVPLFADPEVGLVFSNCWIFNDQGMQRLQYHSSSDYSTEQCFDALLTRYYLSIPTVVIRRAVLGPRHEWVEDDFQVSEEADLFLRIAHRWKLAMVDEPLAKYRVHAGSDTWNKSDRFLIEALRMLQKYRSTIPDFDRLHSVAAQHYEDRARYADAIFRWRTGAGADARAQLRRIRRKTVKQRILWTLSFLPFRMLEPFLLRLSKIFPA